MGYLMKQEASEKIIAAIQRLLQGEIYLSDKIKEKMLHRFDHGDATTADIDLLYNVASNIEGNTICALGDAAAWPVKGFIEKFRSEFEARCRPERSFIALNVVHGRRNTAETLVRTTA